MAGLSNLDTIEEYSESHLSSNRSVLSDNERLQNSEDEYLYQPNGLSPKGNKTNKAKKKGKKAKVDMTPPDKLHRRCKKKAKELFEEGDKYGGITEMLRCTALARIVYGDCHWEYAASYAALAQAYLEHMEYIAQAEHFATTAKGLLMSVTDDSEQRKLLETSILSSCILGRALGAQQKFNAAETEFKTTDKLCKELDRINPNSSALWAIKLNLARAKLCTKQKKYANALRYYERGLRLLEEQYGQDSEELIPVYQGMGKVQILNEQHEDAIHNYLQAHSIASSVHKGGGAEVAATAHALAEAYVELGTDHSYHAAEGYYDEALGLYVTAYGADDAIILKLKDEKAQLLMKSQQHEEAVELLKESLSLKIEKYGDYSLEVADTWKIIANAYLAMAEFVKAADAFKKCHKIEAELLTKNHKRPKDTQRSLDILMKNPQVASKFKTKEDELSERPRFNSIVSRAKPMGGFKPN